MRISHLFILLLTAQLAVPGAAQVPGIKKIDSAVKSIRRAEGVVKLKLPNVTGITLSSREMARQSALFEKQYKKATADLEAAQKALSAPIELTYNKKPIVIGQTTPLAPAVTQKVTVSAKQHQIDDTLYNWGEMLAKNNTTTSAPQLWFENESVILTLKPNRAIIGEIPDMGIETVITPLEIGVNATTLKSVTETYSQEMVTAIFQQNLEQAALFTYLHENFIQSLAQFDAAADAVHTLLPSKASWRNLKPGQSAQNQLIRQNYTHAAANLAIDTINLLQFMDLQREVFAPALQSYTEIMRLHNTSGAKIPATFQTFWKGQISI